MSNKHDSLGDRMKTYEAVPKVFLTRRVPVIIRLDGKAFHTFTRGFQKPFDFVLMNAMEDTMKYLCENIQGCVLGYTQSDEITLVLIDYQTLTSDAWFDYNVEKITSISASMATLAFNRAFAKCVASHNERILDMKMDYPENTFAVEECICVAYNKALDRGALFDSRVFNVPCDDVMNVLEWRQQDATRNSIQMVGQANFSHKQLHGKSCNDIQEMLFVEKGINWNNYTTRSKRGVCCIKKPMPIVHNGVAQTDGENVLTRNKWVIDYDIPIFHQQPEYINRLIGLE